MLQRRKSPGATGRWKRKEPPRLSEIHKNRNKPDIHTPTRKEPTQFFPTREAQNHPLPTGWELLRFVATNQCATPSGFSQPMVQNPSYTGRALSTPHKKKQHPPDACSFSVYHKPKRIPTTAPIPPTPKDNRPDHSPQTGYCPGFPPLTTTQNRRLFPAHGAKSLTPVL